MKESPFHRLFEIEVVSVDDQTDTITLKMPHTSNVERADGTKQYHGGAISSLIDIAGDFALIWKLGYGVPTIDFRTDFFRPAFDTTLTAKATIRRAGRSIGICDVDVLSDAGKLIAVGRGCYSTRKG